MEDLHYRLLDLLGGQTADWDFVDEETSLDIGQRVICERYLVVDRIRSPFNLGSIFRLADSFGIKKIYIVEGGAEPTHQRTIKVGRGTVETVEHEIISEESLLAGLKNSELPLFALESGELISPSSIFPLQESASSAAKSSESVPLSLICATSVRGGFRSPWAGRRDP